MTPVQLSPIASTALVVFYILGSLTLTVVLGGIAFLLYKVNHLLEEYRTKIDPALDKVNQVLEITARRVDSIGGKAERILMQGEEITENVHHRVERTASSVQRTVNAPLIGVNSLAAGLGRGLATFARLQNREKRPAELPVITTIAPPIAQSVVASVPDEPVRIDKQQKNKQNETERIPVGAGLPEKEYRNGG